MAERFFKQFGRSAKLVVIFPLWIVSAFGFFRVTVIPCARSIISHLVSRCPSHWIAVKPWLSPPYIYILLNLIILAIAAQNHLRQTPSRKAKTKQQPLAQEIDEGIKEESSDFSTEHLGVGPPSPAAVDFLDQEKLGDEKRDEEGGEVETLEEAWKMIMEAQGKKSAMKSQRVESAS